MAQTWLQGREGAALFFHADFARDLEHEVTGNDLADLAENGDASLGWCVFGFHLCRVAEPLNINQPFFCGMAVHAHYT